MKFNNHLGKVDQHVEAVMHHLQEKFVVYNGYPVPAVAVFRVFQGNLEAVLNNNTSPPLTPSGGVNSHSIWLG